VDIILSLDSAILFSLLGPNFLQRSKKLPPPPVEPEDTIETLLLFKMGTTELGTGVTFLRTSIISSDEVDFNRSEGYMNYFSSEIYDI